MGDLIEFTTPNKHQNLFYKVTNSAVVFSVKGAANACVGLARTPSLDDCVYWVVIGFRNSCFLVRRGLRKRRQVRVNILTSLEFRKFWISWKNQCIQFGKDGEQTPILSQRSLVCDISFVTFCAFDQNDSLYWKCYLPPQTLSLKPILKKVSGGKPQWVKFDKKLPEGAIIGGYENEILYIMRAVHETALTPGKFVPSTGKGYVAWGGRMHEKTEFEIFCGYDCIWMPTSDNNIPVGAIEAGYTEIVHEIMYIGRALCDGHYIPGKIAPSHSVCYIPFDGKEIAKRKYEILVDPFKANKSVNDFYVSNLHNCRHMRQYVPYLYSLPY